MDGTRRRRIPRGRDRPRDKDAGLRDDPPAERLRTARSPGDEYAALDHVHRATIPGSSGARRDPGGSGRRVPGGRGLPASGSPRPVPRASRPGLRLRAAASPFTGRTARVIARAPAGGPAPGCSRTTTFRGSPAGSAPDAPAVAAMLLLTLPASGVRVPGRRDRDGGRTRRRSTVRPRRPRRLQAPDAVGVPGPPGDSRRGHRGCRSPPGGQRSVAGQRGQSGSMLELYRELIAIRPQLGEASASSSSTPPGEMLIYRPRRAPGRAQPRRRGAALPAGATCCRTAPRSAASATLGALAGAAPNRITPGSSRTLGLSP